MLIGMKSIFWGDKNVLKLDTGDGCITLNILKTTEFSTLKRYVLWYMDYVNKAVLKKKKKMTTTMGRSLGNALASEHSM